MARYFVDNPALSRGCGVRNQGSNEGAIQMRLPIAEGRHR